MKIHIISKKMMYKSKLRIQRSLEIPVGTEGAKSKRISPYLIHLSGISFA